MNARLLALACLLAAPPALAQRPPEVLQTPLGPPGSPPPAPESPQSPEQPPPQNVWLPQKTADLIALDKVSVPVGQSAGFGSLTIDVRACLVRPPDQAADATAWLDITDSHPGSPQFHGWILLSAPGLSMLQHPVYDIRLADCR